MDVLPDNDDNNTDAVVAMATTYAFSGIAPAIPDSLYRLRLPPDFARYGPKLQCSNVVCTYQLSPPGDRRLNVAELSRTLPGVAYDPKRFAACTLRTGRATTLIFDRGSAVCVGTTSVAQARLAALRFTLFLLRTGQLVSFLLYTVTIAASIGALASFVSAIQEAGGAAERVFELLELHPDIASPAVPAPDVGPVRGAVEFHGVSFAYREDTPWVLRDIDLVVRPASSRSIAASISRSLSVSRLLVASSRISTAGSFSSARAMAIRWRWPPESFTPRSPTFVL